MAPTRILIVEDEVIIAMCMEMELEEAGYQIYETISTGEEAVMIARQDPPDVILMDVHLSGKIDGIEAAHQIQAFCSIPIIFMTGYPDKATEKKAKALNPLGFFTKPVPIYVLKPLLASITTTD